MEAERGQQSPPAAWWVWMKLTQPGLPPTSLCNPASAREGLRDLALAGGEGAAQRHGSAYFSGMEGVKQGAKVASWDAHPDESLPGLPDVHVSRHGFLLRLKPLARCHGLPLTLALLDRDLHHTGI